MKKIYRRIGKVAIVLLLLVAGMGIYLNNIIPKFDSREINLQKELFAKPKQELPVEGKYIYKSASDLAQMIRQGKASSFEIVSEHLNLIHNSNYKLNALIYMRAEEALEEAKQADLRVLKGDTIDKPLLGVPITIKEMFWVKGSPSTMNAKMYGFVAPRNAEVVKTLKEAGAIILGTTNVPYMLSDYQTQGEIYPTANNPFDTSRTPGGSTGGGAAAVAAGFSTMDLGSDLGGSIRVPAVFCGLWSLKTTYGAVNITDGTSPDSAYKFTRMAMASAGPLARTPDDLDLAWKVLRNTKLDSRFQKPVDWKPANKKPINQYKIAWTDDWNANDKNVKISIETKQKLFTLIDSLKNHNVQVKKDAPKIYIELQKMFLASFASMMGENQPWLLRKFMELDFKKTDDGSGNFEAFSQAIMDASDEDWKKIESDRVILISKMEDFFQHYDFLISPVTYDAAFKKQESWLSVKTDDGESLAYMNYFPFSYIINATGHPAITVPLGLNKKGLPIGIQVIGKYYSEAELIHFAKLIEPLTPKYVTPNL